MVEDLFVLWRRELSTHQSGHMTSTLDVRPGIVLRHRESPEKSTAFSMLAWEPSWKSDFVILLFASLVFTFFCASIMTCITTSQLLHLLFLWRVPANQFPRRDGTYFSASRRFVFLIRTLLFFLLQSWEGFKNYSESGHDLLGNITCLWFLLLWCAEPKRFSTAIEFTSATYSFSFSFPLYFLCPLR